jgi:hypothetical protein
VPTLVVAVTVDVQVGGVVSWPPMEGVYSALTVDMAPP